MPFLHVYFNRKLNVTIKLNINTSFNISTDQAKIQNGLFVESRKKGLLNHLFKGIGNSVFIYNFRPKCKTKTRPNKPTYLSLKGYLNSLFYFLRFYANQ